LLADKDQIDSEEAHFEYEAQKDALSNCYRTALGMADVEVRKRVATRFATMLRTESGGVINTFAELFFRASDIQDLLLPDRALVRDYLLGRMQDQLSKELLKVLEGIGKVLNPSDVGKFIDAVIRSVLRKSSFTARAVGFLERECELMEENVKEALQKRLGEWRTVVERRGDESAIEAIKTLSAAAEDIPF
jgi:hypothetical protein